MTNMRRQLYLFAASVLLVVTGAFLEAQAAAGRSASGQQRPPQPAPSRGGQPAPGAVAPQIPPGVTPPQGYTIGADDVLIVIFWQEKEMSAEVTVRPDGKISLPLLNDVQAAGLTPEQLRLSLVEAGTKFLQEPNATVVVKTINSRKVFITGQVSKPGPYLLTAPTSILQLIAMAGGLQEYADREHIVLIRTENGRQTSYRFNYKEVSQQKKLAQNLELTAGDTVLVP